MPAVTSKQVAAAFEVVVLVGQLIRELKSVPNGELYVRLADKLSIESYTSIIKKLEDAKLVKQSNYVLTWIGPDGN